MKKLIIIILVGSTAIAPLTSFSENDEVQKTERRICFYVSGGINYFLMDDWDRTIKKRSSIYGGSKPPTIRIGPSIGTGVQVEILRNFIVGIEYQYLNHKMSYQTYCGGEWLSVKCKIGSVTKGHTVQPFVSYYPKVNVIKANPFFRLGLGAGFTQFEFGRTDISSGRDKSDGFGLATSIEAGFEFRKNGRMLCLRFGYTYYNPKISYSQYIVEQGYEDNSVNMGGVYIRLSFGGIITYLINREK